jgi:hypothetical protein
MTGCTVSVAGAVVALRLGACSQPLAPGPYVMGPVLKPESVPPPLLVMVTTWLAGLAPPWIAEKLRVATESPMLGGGVTLTCEEPD